MPCQASAAEDSEDAEFFFPRLIQLRMNQPGEKKKPFVYEGLPLIVLIWEPEKKCVITCKEAESQCFLWQNRVS